MLSAAIPILLVILLAFTDNPTVSSPVDTAIQVGRASHAADLRLHEIRIEPPTAGLKINLPEGAPMDRQRAGEIAAEAKRQLIAQGYPNAQVDFELSPAPHYSLDLHLTVAAGDVVRVKEVAFLGETGIAPGELRGRLRALRSRRVLLWTLSPGYSEEAVNADLSRLRSLYIAKGYYDAEVRLEDAGIEGKQARIEIHADAGSRYNARAGDLCSSLLAQRREAESRGILDFAVTLHVRRAGVRGDVELTTAIEPGPAYRVGRIDFTGNHRFGDATIRPNLQLDEGAVFDQRALRKSLARLDQTNLFEPLSGKDVAMRTNPETGIADLRLHLTERKRGAWRLAGPVGTPSFAGSLQASLSSRLPPWGAGLLELSTYTASISLIAFAHPIIPALAVVQKNGLIFALERPFSAAEGWKSGFIVAPQLGWRGMTLSYATTQMRQRFLPRIQGDRGLTPELLVRVDGPSGDEIMVCDPPKPGLMPLRTAASVGLQFVGAVASFH